MSANVDGLIQEAIRASQNGDKESARRFLESATDNDPMNESAWLWMSRVVDSPDDQKICLENVIYINPENNDARRNLQILLDRHPELRTGDQDESYAEEEIASDDDPYLVPTSSTSGINQGDQLSSSDYDSWISDMMSTSASDPAPAAPPEEPAIDLGDNFADMFGLDDLRQEMVEDDGDTMDFSSPAPSIPPGADDLLAGFDESVFGFDASFDDPTAPSREPDIPPPPRQSPPEKRRQKANTATLIDEEPAEAIDPGVYFRAIPPEIKATRLPGMDERYSPIVIPMIMILVLLNIGAVAFLVLNLAG